MESEVDNVEYIAHISSDGTVKQTVKEHCENVAQKAKAFGSCFGAGEKAFIAGLLHDIGKYSAEFQNRILGSNQQVDHSTAGAKEAYSMKLPEAAFAIAGHHGGLPELGSRFDSENEPTFCGRLNRSVPDYSAFQTEISTPVFTGKQAEFNKKYEEMFFIRMLFSCLVDADYLDTEAFMTGSERSYISDSLEEINKKLDEYLVSLTNGPTSELNMVRSRLLRECIASGSHNDRGIYKLSLPTGSGKTIDSIAYAIKNAIHNGHKRVIYVIPYTSIIDQTSGVYTNIFGSNNVLEHHSGVEYSESDEDSKNRLASENWDMPIVITTAVQFFESLYAYETSRTRKLHNIADSVIVFDEVQTLPVSFLDPCLKSIYELYNNYRCSILLCTATQPPFERIFKRLGINLEIRDICHLADTERELFNRCSIEGCGAVSEESLREKVSAHQNCLAVFNTKRTACRFYESLQSENKYCLTTNLCPYDRKKIIESIKTDLKSGKPCVVVSTSLIEAGVDLDFECVFREIYGIDSIIQTAGRCNREGKRNKDNCKAYYFTLIGEKAWTGIEHNIAASRNALKDKDVLHSTDDYFEFLWFYLRDTDKHEILPLHEKGYDGTKMPFREIGKRFKLIDTEMTPVYILRKESKDLINTLKSDAFIGRDDQRKLNQFAVNVNQRVLQELKDAGALEVVKDTYYILVNSAYYSLETGIHTDCRSEEIIV